LSPMPCPSHSSWSLYFWMANRKTIDNPKWYLAFHDFSLLLISSWRELWFVRVIPKDLNCCIHTHTHIKITLCLSK
jgi:hypothetical protein